MRTELHLYTSAPDADVLLMDLPKAFGTVNRATSWTTLYKKELPIQMISRVRGGRKNTQLHAKSKPTYGELIRNNIGVVQVSAISAILFIIYG